MSPAPNQKQKSTPAGRVLTLEGILEAEDRPVVDVEVEEWGGIVKVRGLSKGARDAVREASFDAEGNFHADQWENALLVHGLVEPEITAEEVGQLRDKAASAVETIVQAVMEQSKMGRGAVESALATFL